LIRRIVPLGRDDPKDPEVIVKTGARWAGLVMLAVCLVVTSVVDADGDPLTQDFPAIVLISPTPSVEATRAEEGEETDGEGERPRARRRERAFALHRGARRWKAVVQRWHRSFLGDPPI
jgi:hypothetical protein